MGRLGWILVTGAAGIGGMIFQDRIGFDWGDQDRAVIVDSRGAHVERLDRQTGKAVAAAAGRLVKAEVRLARLEAVGSPSESELAAARAERDRAEAELDRLETAIETRDAADDRRVSRDQVREDIRSEIREAVR